jgi:hypothetical protein
VLPTPSKIFRPILQESSTARKKNRLLSKYVANSFLEGMFLYSILWYKVGPIKRNLCVSEACYPAFRINFKQNQDCQTVILNKYVFLGLFLAPFPQFLM